MSDPQQRAGVGVISESGDMGTASAEIASTSVDYVSFFTRTVGVEALRGKRIAAGVVLDLVDIAAGRIAYEFAEGVVATVSFDRVDITAPVLHGDLVRLDAQLLNVGKSSMLVQVRVYRLDIVRRRFVQAQYCLVTMVAIDETLRPRRIGRPLLSPYANSVEVRTFLETRDALHREMSQKLAALDDLEQFADAGAVVDPELLRLEVFERLPIAATRIELRRAFFPSSLNHNKTVFGGDVLIQMEEAATVCARRFARHENMHTISMTRINFKLPLFVEDVVELVAQVVYSRVHTCFVTVTVVVQRGRRGEQQGKVFVSHTGGFVLISLDEAGSKRPLTVGLDLAASSLLERRAYARARTRFHCWRANQAKFLPADYDAAWPHIPVPTFLRADDAALWAE